MPAVQMMCGICRPDPFMRYLYINASRFDPQINQWIVTKNESHFIMSSMDSIGCLRTVRLNMLVWLGQYASARLLSHTVKRGSKPNIRAQAAVGAIPAMASRPIHFLRR